MSQCSNDIFSDYAHFYLWHVLWYSVVCHVYARRFLTHIYIARFCSLKPGVTLARGMRSGPERRPPGPGRARKKPVHRQDARLRGGETRFRLRCSGRVVVRDTERVRFGRQTLQCAVFHIPTESTSRPLAPGGTHARLGPSRDRKASRVNFFRWLFFLWKFTQNFYSRFTKNCTPIP